jgi:hypothetical protein
MRQWGTVGRRGIGADSSRLSVLRRTARGVQASRLRPSCASAGPQYRAGPLGGVADRAASGARRMSDDTMTAAGGPHRRRQRQQDGEPGAKGGKRVTVGIALAANLVIAAAKVAGGLVTRSPALLSEAALGRRGS